MASTKALIDDARAALKLRFEQLEDKRQILREATLKELYGQIRTLPEDERAGFGAAVNELKDEVQGWLDTVEVVADERAAIDVTAPFDVNVPRDKRPDLHPVTAGSQHPLTHELERMMAIFERMGFDVKDCRQLDNDYNMFSALNFPANHPARDDYDTFMTEEGLIPPAQTSTMQNRILRGSQPPIRAVIPGRCYRNEDLDARHEHTFYQVEGVYVDKGIAVTDLLGTIKTFLEAYFGRDLEFRTQPFYFPFVEPGLEFMVSCPFCDKKGCSVCGHSGWMEIMGCGMIHPNVLTEAGIDPKVYSGFAWGFGVDRLVMVKQNVEDIRHFNSGKLAFLRQFGRGGEG